MIEWRRLSAESGFWKTICSAFCSDALRRRASASRSAPSSWIVAPSSGAMIPISTRASVVLPEPDSPTNPTVSPARMSRSTPSRPRIAWPERWNVFDVERIRISGSSLIGTGAPTATSSPPESTWSSVVTSVTSGISEARSE